MNLSVKNVGMSLKCLSSKMMSLLARPAVTKNPQKKCPLSDFL
jgi:hypothetical protein